MLKETSPKETNRANELQSINEILTRISGVWNALPKTPDFGYHAEFLWQILIEPIYQKMLPGEQLLINIPFSKTKGSLIDRLQAVFPERIKTIEYPDGGKADYFCVDASPDKNHTSGLRLDLIGEKPKTDSPYDVYNPKFHISDNAPGKSVDIPLGLVLGFQII